MLVADFSAALAAVLNAVFVLVSVFIYVSLIRQIAARRSTIAPERPESGFGLAETVLAVGLIGFFLWVVVASFSIETRSIGMRDFIAGALLTLALLLFILAFLKLRRLDLISLAGLSRIGFLRTVTTGAILLLAALPIIYLADALTRSAAGGDASHQQVIELLNASRAIGQRITIIVVAVVIAPVAEEFIFRFFLYGVLKRYFGAFLGVVFNAALFAAVHTHWPSFAPLFVLGACFTIAYEWSGSILVSMTMHALFNSFSLTLLAFPELFPQ